MPISDTKIPVPTELDEAELRLLYKTCQQKLLETEAALAKAESTAASLTAEKQEL